MKDVSFEELGRVHLISISSEICEDSFENGEGAFTGCGLDDSKVGETFESAQDMLTWLARHFGLGDKPVDYELRSDTLHTDKTVAHHSEAQNGGWFPPTSEETAAWKAGRLMLYNEHYTVKFIRVK